ncbi:MAG: OmpA family protein [Deltaproteobacteria bacterium]|nr:OmpA family protein [Deltaproteobacteria bacterium]
MATLCSSFLLAAAFLTLGAPLPLYSQDQAPVQASADGKLTATVSEASVRGEALTLKISLANESQTTVEPELPFLQFYYVDFHNHRKYEALKDDQGQYQAGPQTYPWSGGTFKERLKPGEQRLLWIKFPAPPKETKAITVFLPGFLPLEEVRVQSGPIPDKAEPADLHPKPGLPSASPGLTLSGEGRDIVGLPSLAFTGTAVSLDQMMQDLGGKKVGQEIQVALSGDLLFDFDKWDIKKEAEDTLKKLSGLIKKLNKTRVAIEGHTDAKGSDQYNLELSRKRAQAVKAWLQSNGELNKVKFQAKGLGEAKPVAPNTHPDGSDNPEGRAKNRRVEIRITD